MDREIAFWRDTLAGAPEVMDLPHDHPRPAVQSYLGETRLRRLDGDLAEGLRRLARGHRATMFMVLLAAFEALLRRYGAGPDLVLGTHVAGRGRLEIEEVVGFFVNALVLRTDAAGDPPFDELLDRVRSTCLAAFSHQDVPFERVVEELQPRRDLSLSPLYQVAFDLDQGDDLAEETAPPLLVSNPSAKFDLDLTVETRASGLVVAVEASRDLFDATTVVRLLDHYASLLDGIVAHPGSRLSDLPLMSAGERAQVLHELPGEARSYPLDRTLHGWIEERFDRVPPERTAVVAGDRRLTYGELEAASNRLAHLLVDRGVVAGDVVGVWVDRGLDFAVAVLAVLKAGAAYLPFETSYPEERLRYMVTDSGIRVLIAAAGPLAARPGVIAAGASLCDVICVDGDGTEKDGVQRDGPLPRRLGPAAVAAASPRRFDRPRGGSRFPAYVLYTSGSTGAPKGAVVRHDGAVNHLFAERELLGLGEELVFLQSAPASSDMSVWQLLAPLAFGGRTVVADADTVSDPRRLAALLRDQGVTLAELVPAVLRQLLDHLAEEPPERAALPAMRCLIASGEAVPVDLVDEWLRRFPHTLAVNAYGPTEAADDVVQLTLRRPSRPGLTSLPIGRPLPNFRCYVLGPHLEPVPAGVPGEICIAGVGVGLGYRNHPGRTAASFVPDPYAPVGGGVLYRTGDLGRWLADGNLEFRGRVDRQVQIRGFRIEPEEVRAALVVHPEVADACVTVRREGGEERLVAYVVRAPGSDPAVGTLRGFAGERLPGHMVPSLFVVLDALPTTPVGKVDHAALPAPEVEVEERVPPTTGTEVALAAIWCEVLPVDEVGVGSDFFALGGHSLLATQVLARVRRTFGVDLALRKLFEHPTLGELARAVDEAATESPAAIPGIRRLKRERRRLDGGLGAGAEAFRRIQGGHS